jgi:hypothetical protein
LTDKTNELTQTKENYELYYTAYQQELLRDSHKARR